MKSAILFSAISVLLSFKSGAQNTCVPAIASGLIAYYPFCNSANDVSGNNLNGTITGAALTTDRFGNSNSAFSFNGTSNYIQVANNALLNFGTGDFSISAWTYTSSSASEMILHKGSTFSSPQYFLRLHDSPSSDVLLLTSSGGTPNESYTGNCTASVSNGQWHHVVGVRNAGTLILYFDGTQIYSGALTNRNVTNTFDMFIGCQNNGGTLTNFFNGKLDDIYLFNKALNQTEVNQLHITNTTSSCTPLISGGLVGYFPFCGSASDASGNGNNGTVSGATLVADRFGNPNNAYTFNGTTDKIDCGMASTTLFANGISFCAWINPASHKLSSVVDRMQNTEGGFRINTRDVANGSNVWAQANNYTTPAFAISTSTCTPTQWMFMTGTWSTDDSVKIYINGALENKTKITYDMSAPYPILIGIGQRSLNYEPFQGSIDDVSIYSRELLPCEIQTLYSGNPAFVASISGTTTVCSGSPTTLTASGGSTYLWSTNATTTSIVVSPTAASVYTVTATNAGGCTAVATTSVAVSSLPATPTINANMSVLTSSSATGNQWYLASSPIAGATAQTCSVTQNGVYMVCTTDANSCSSCSAPYTFSVTGFIEQINGVAISVFPIPASEKININFITTKDERMSVEIINTLGQIIRSFDLGMIPSGTNTNTLNLGDVPNGIYCLRISGNNLQQKVSVVIGK